MVNVEIKVNLGAPSILREILSLYMLHMLNIDEIHILMTLNQTNIVRCSIN